MSEGSDHALLDRAASGIHGPEGPEQSSAPLPGQLQPAGSAEPLRHQFDAAAIRRDYLQAAVAHPHLFREDDAALAAHVEAVVGHFAADGLTRADYFKALATDPRLLRQKPTSVIGNVEAVMDRYDATPALRRDYLRAAVQQPPLFRTPPAAVFATIEAAADRLEAQGVTSTDLQHRAAMPSGGLRQESEVITTGADPETTPASAAGTPPPIAPGHAATPSPLPSTCAQHPTLFVSYVPAQVRAR
jgi:hypothetical protein